MQRYSVYPHLTPGMDEEKESEDDARLTNGRKSFANPNYHLDPNRISSELGSDYQDTYQYLLSLKDAADARKVPSQLALDIQKCCSQDRSHMSPGERKHIENLKRRSLDLTRNPGFSARQRMFSKPDLIRNADKIHKEKENYYEKPYWPMNHDQCWDRDYEPCPIFDNRESNDIYAVPVKCKSKSTTQNERSDSDENVSSNEKDDSNPLWIDNLFAMEDGGSSSNEYKDSKLDPETPCGWEHHEDNTGPYYWNVKTGSIQRQNPSSMSDMKKEETNSNKEKELAAELSVQNDQPLITSSDKPENFETQNRKKKEENLLKRRSCSTTSMDEKDKGIRFAVRSLGWIEIAEQDLSSERSSKAVNKCIMDLSLGLNNVMDTVGRWGDGKELFMDLDEGSLKLIDPENCTVLNTQPIHTIRVWGVGRDNGRDFAYVARDRTTKMHMCHVFRCDIPARTIANTLRDICKKIMIERSMQQCNITKTIDMNGTCKPSSGIARPTNLPVEHKKNHRNYTSFVQSFPTPMEEPRRVIKGLYLGIVQVTKPSGMDVLNDAIELLIAEKPQNEWEPVNIAVAPSTVTVLQFEDDKLLLESRVRYLSFLGIGKDHRNCAYIMHTAQDQFVAHVFHCEPSSGVLCKTIEAACKLRYQKCLDAHSGGLSKSQSTDHVTSATKIGATLKALVGSLTGKKVNSNS